MDLIIDGHSHTEMSGDDAKTVGGALAVSTGMYLENVGVVIIDSEKKASAQLVSAAEWTKVDEEVAAIVNAKDAEVKAELGKAFATTEVKLNGERDPGNRTEETNLGDFAADAILWGARQALGEDQVDVALTNGGGIRASIEAGDITMDDMKTVFPGPGGRLYPGHQRLHRRRRRHLRRLCRQEHLHDRRRPGGRPGELHPGRAGQCGYR